MRATSSTYSRPPLWLLGLVVARLDEVLRAHEADAAVDDQQLAVVAQVGALELALERADREHRVPVDARGVEALLELGVLRDAARAHVVEQQPHLHASSDGGHQRLEERRRHVVPGGDVELHLDGLRGGLHLGRHRDDRVAVAGDQVDVVARLEGQRAEVEVEGRHRGQVRRPGHGLGRQQVGGRPDGLVGLALPPEPTPAEVGPAQEQEDHEARERDDQDQDQPGHRGRRLAVVGQHPDRQELDDVVGDDQHHADDGEEVVHYGVRAWAQVVGMSAPPSCDTRAPICT